MAKDAKAPKTSPKIPPKSPQKEEVTKNYDERALFLQHLPLVREGQIEVEIAQAQLKSTKESLKRLLSAAAADGFSRADFEYAKDVQGPEKEAETKGNIARRLKIAGFMGSDLGNQLDLFLEPDRTPIADRAYEEGRRQAQQNLPAKPSYDPSTEAYRQYLKGFHSVTEELVKSGFVPLTSEADEVSKH